MVQLPLTLHHLPLLLKLHNFFHVHGFSILVSPFLHIGTGWHVLSNEEPGETGQGLTVSWMNVNRLFE